MYVGGYVGMYVRAYVRMYVRMYVCMYVCMYGSSSGAHVSCLGLMLWLAGRIGSLGLVGFWVLMGFLGSGSFRCRVGARFYPLCVALPDFREYRRNHRAIQHEPA